MKSMKNIIPKILRKFDALDLFALLTTSSTCQVLDVPCNRTECVMKRFDKDATENGISDYESINMCRQIGVSNVKESLPVKYCSTRRIKIII